MKEAGVPGVDPTAAQQPSHGSGCPSPGDLSRQGAQAGGDSLEGEEPGDLLAPPSLLGANKLQTKAPVFLKHNLGGEEIFETTKHRSHKRR